MWLPRWRAARRGPMDVLRGNIETPPSPRRGARSPADTGKVAEHQFSMRSPDRRPSASANLRNVARARARSDRCSRSACREIPTSRDTNTSDRQPTPATVLDHARSGDRTCATRSRRARRATVELRRSPPRFRLRSGDRSRWSEWHAGKAAGRGCSPCVWSWPTTHPPVRDVRSPRGARPVATRPSVRRRRHRHHRVRRLVRLTKPDLRIDRPTPPMSCRRRK